MAFTDELRQAADPTWTAQHEHPFVRGIGDGSLEPAKFRRHLVVVPDPVGEHRQDLGDRRAALAGSILLRPAKQPAAETNGRQHRAAFQPAVR